MKRSIPDGSFDDREKVKAASAADVEKMVVLAVGKASEVEAGDADHPGALKDAAKLPLARLPLRDPLTLKPLP